MKNLTFGVTLLVMALSLPLKAASFTDSILIIDNAINIALQVDDIIGDTIAEGDVGEIKSFKAFSVDIIRNDTPTITINLTSDYQTIENMPSTMTIKQVSTFDPMDDIEYMETSDVLSLDAYDLKTGSKI